MARVELIYQMAHPDVLCPMEALSQACLDVGNVLSRYFGGSDDLQVDPMHVLVEPAVISKVAFFATFDARGTSVARSLVSMSCSQKIAKTIPMPVNALAIFAGGAKVTWCLASDISQRRYLVLVRLVGMIVRALITVRAIAAEEMDIAHFYLLHPFYLGFVI